MEIEELIKRLKCPQIQSCPMEGAYPSCKACQKGVQQEVITALSALQAENEKLRAGLEMEKTMHQHTAEVAWAHEAELEKVKRERDAAVSDLETIIAYGGGNLDTCQFCKNGQCYARGGTRLCYPEWRGVKEGRKASER